MVRNLMVTFRHQKVLSPPFFEYAKFLLLAYFLNEKERRIEMSKSWRWLRWLAVLFIGGATIAPTVVGAETLSRIEGQIIFPYRDDADRLIQTGGYVYWVGAENVLSDQFYFYVRYVGDPVIVTSTQAIPIEYVSFQKISTVTARNTDVQHSIGHDVTMSIDPTVAFDRDPAVTSIATQLEQLEQRLASGATFTNKDTLWLANLYVLKAQKLLTHDLVPESVIDSMLYDFTWINEQLDRSEKPNPLALKHLVDEVEGMFDARVDESQARDTLLQELAAAKKILANASTPQTALNLAQQKLAAARTLYESEQEIIEEKVPNTVDEVEGSGEREGETGDILEESNAGHSSGNNEPSEATDSPEETGPELSQEAENLNKPTIDDDESESGLEAGSIDSNGTNETVDSRDAERPVKEMTTQTETLWSESLVLNAIRPLSPVRFQPLVSQRLDTRGEREVILGTSVLQPRIETVRGESRVGKSRPPRMDGMASAESEIPEGIVADDIVREAGEVAGANSGIAGAIAQKENVKPTTAPLSAQSLGLGFLTVFTITGSIAWVYYRRLK